MYPFINCKYLIHCIFDQLLFNQLARALLCEDYEWRCSVKTEEGERRGGCVGVEENGGGSCGVHYAPVVPIQEVWRVHQV